MNEITRAHLIFLFGYIFRIFECIGLKKTLKMTQFAVIFNAQCTEHSMFEIQNCRSFNIFPGEKMAFRLKAIEYLYATRNSLGVGHYLSCILQFSCLSLVFQCIRQHIYICTAHRTHNCLHILFVGHTADYNILQKSFIYVLLI